MRYAVLSDVHSNLEALQAVLECLQGQRVEAFVCCGDLVGYGPDPDPCLKLLAGLPGLRAVIGNHDLAVLGRMDLEWFNAYAQAAALWTRGRLGPEGQAFLRALADTLEAPGFSAVHGSPRSPAEEYLLTSEQYLANLPHLRASPCFIGHSHLPVYFAQAPDGRVHAGRLKDREVVRLAGRGPWILNPGSVGQPRDGDPRASCGVYDSQAQTFQLFRVAYPIAAVQKKIRAAGLPEMLAVRLAYGE